MSSWWIDQCGHSFIIRQDRLAEAAEYLSNVTEYNWDESDFEKQEVFDNGTASYKIASDEGPFWGDCGNIEDNLEEFAEEYLCEGSFVKLYEHDSRQLSMYKIGPKGLERTQLWLEDAFDQLEKELDSLFTIQRMPRSSELGIVQDADAAEIPSTPVAKMLSSRCEATVVWNNLLISAVPYEQDGKDDYSMMIFALTAGGSAPRFISDPVFEQTPTLGVALEKAAEEAESPKAPDHQNVVVVCEQGGHGYTLAELAEDLGITERSLARDVEIASDLSHEPFCDEWTAQMNGDGVEEWTKSWDGTYSIWCGVARDDGYDDKDIPYTYLVNDVNGSPSSYLYASEPIAEGETPDFAWAERCAHELSSAPAKPAQNPSTFDELSELAGDVDKSTASRDVPREER